MRSKTGVVALILCFYAVLLSGCGPFWRGAYTGAAVGAAGVVAVDTISAKNQMDKLDADYKAGNISKEEYEARKDQIKKGSLIY